MQLMDRGNRKFDGRLFFASLLQAVLMVVLSSFFLRSELLDRSVLFLFLLFILINYAFNKLSLAIKNREKSESSSLERTSQSISTSESINEEEESNVITQDEPDSGGLEASLRLLNTLNRNRHILGYFAPAVSNGNKVVVTPLLARLLGFPSDGEKAVSVIAQDWEKALRSLMDSPVEGKDDTYVLNEGCSTDVCFLVQLVLSDKQNLRVGYILDLSNRMRSETEREDLEQYDALTELLTLKSFKIKAGLLLDTEPNKVGAMVSIGLDNVKYVNSSFGHEAGDSYIAAAASLFREFDGGKVVLARVSGDEFGVFIHGFSDRETVQEAILDKLEKMKNRSATLPSEITQKIRFTAGISYYPEHSLKIDALLKFANYAMLEAKRQRRGTILDFNKESYLKKAYRIDKSEAINRLIEENLVDYAFQPILNLHDFSIYGYEALMRPRFEGINSPLEVLELAGMQSKLYDIERMTLFNVMDFLEKNRDELKGKIFFNTLASQSLNPEDEAYLRERYSGLLNSVVFEITEGEIEDEAVFNKKITCIKDTYGSAVAIDDFGAGFSNELRVLSIVPDVVKFDRGLISDIDTDKDKQHIVQNIVSYCKEKNILTLAEGVETKAEFYKIHEMGFDLAQGYFVAYPKLEIVHVLSDEINEYKSLIKK